VRQRQRAYTCAELVVAMFIGMSQLVLRSVRFLRVWRVVEKLSSALL
jgi:hypothetical protein